MESRNKMSYWSAPSFAHLKNKSTIKTDNIIADVCNVYGVKLHELMKQSRLRAIVEPRQILFYILHKKLGIPCAKVGAMFNKNHATVLHGASNITNWVEHDDDLRKSINEIMIRNNCL